MNRARLEELAADLAEEAFVQGFLAGEERGHRRTIAAGESAVLLSEKQIKEGEYPIAPICGHETEELRAILAEPEPKMVPVAWMVETDVPELGGWQRETAHTDEKEASDEARVFRAKPYSIPARVVPLYDLRGSEK